MRRVISVLLVLAMVFALAGCGGGQTLDGSAKKVVMITDTGGLGDESFNDLAYEGILRAAEDFGIQYSVLESATADDYAPNIAAAVEEGADLIVCVGFLFEGVLAEMAVQYPDQLFALVDAQVDAPNVAGLTFSEEEGSFLVGVAAGLMTETDKVGYIGGMQFPVIEKFQYGYQAGVKAANPDAQVFVAYTQSFDDSAAGKENALAQHNQGADVIYHAAGGCGIGLIQAADEQGFWAIGVDQDQSSLAPDHVLCSMIKRVDVAVYDAIKLVLEDSFTGNDIKYALSADGVGISDNAGNVPEDIMEQVEAWKAKIVAGDFAVPYDLDTFEAFEVPEM
ncbi:MAG TPA: BMP family ABC transporter substrate-binding protein [Clostridiales bacterium]|jgi:basic membrane protein A|nr:BMP family ABC transporter substrate-binding protein [Clostridiales bacterium]